MLCSSVAPRFSFPASFNVWKFSVQWNSRAGWMILLSLSHGLWQLCTKTLLSSHESLSQETLPEDNLVQGLQFWNQFRHFHVCQKISWILDSRWCFWKQIHYRGYPFRVHSYIESIKVAMQLPFIIIFGDAGSKVFKICANVMFSSRRRIRSTVEFPT